MKIADNKVVEVEYILKNQHDKLLEATDGEPLVYLHGSGLLPGVLEDTLDGKTAGDKFQLTISPEDAYGEYNDSLRYDVARESFQGMDIKVGEKFMAAQDEKNDEGVVTIVEIKENHVTIDANHELAGMTLNFDVSVVGVRDATEEEIDHGHAHGPGGHHH